MSDSNIDITYEITKMCEGIDSDMTDEIEDHIYIEYFEKIDDRIPFISNKHLQKLEESIRYEKKIRLQKRLKRLALRMAAISHHFIYVNDSEKDINDPLFDRWLATRSSQEVYSWLDKGLPTDKQVDNEIRQMLDDELDDYQKQK